MAYLYRHIRLDKNEPFYIGIGSDSNNEYKRANTHKNRNKHWENIVAKTEYRVDILCDDMTWEEVIKKEIEFIALYGRVDLKTGTLCNLTGGGQGAFGYIKTKEHIEKIRLIHKGRKMSFEQRLEFNKNYLKRDLSDSDIERMKHRIKKEKVRASGEKNTTHTPERNIRMSKMFTGKDNPFYGKKHSDEWKLKQSISKSKQYVGGSNPAAKIVIDLSTGIYYDCAKDAAIAINKNVGVFRGMLNGGKKNKTEFKYI